MRSLRTSRVFSPSVAFAAAFSDSVLVCITIYEQFISLKRLVLIRYALNFSVLADLTCKSNPKQTSRLIDRFGGWVGSVDR